MFTIDEQGLGAEGRRGSGVRRETWGLGRQRVSAFSSQMIDKGRDLPVTRHCLNRVNWLAGWLGTNPSCMRTCMRTKVKKASTNLLHAFQLTPT